MSNTIHVSASANGDSANGSSSNPYLNIQDAINAAQNGDTILVAKGTYYENLRIKDKSLNIVSASGPDQTTIQAASTASVVYYEGAIHEGTLNGFSIAGGAGYRGVYNQYGGGIDVANIPAGSAMDIKNCIVRDNNSGSITFGGGLHIGGGGTVNLTNTLIRDNYAWANGGAILVEGANLVMDACTVVNNRSDYYNEQGGISAAGNCDIQIKNSILWDNQGSQYGSFTSGPGGIGKFTFENTAVAGGVNIQSGWGNTKTRSYSTGSNFTSDPVFSGASDYSLSPDSPFADAGSDSAPLDPDGSRAALGYRSIYAEIAPSEIVYSSVTYTLQAGEKHLILTGDATIDGTGNELDNSITGNNAANFLDGQAGNDTLQSGGGDDTLVGGDGDDLLVVGGSAGGSKYEVIQGNFTWDEAKADAEARGGHLVTVGSDEEWNKIKDLLPMDSFIWLGGSDQNAEGEWKWVDETPWNYSNWAPGEPNNDGGENYLLAYNGDHTWNDGANSPWWGGTPYVLETESASASSSGDSSLSGGAGNDTLQGGGGNDTLVGGDGNDLLVVSNSAQQLELGGWATGDNNFALYKGDINGNNLKLLATDSDQSWGTTEPVETFNLNFGEYLYAVVVEEGIGGPTGLIADLGLVTTSDLSKWSVSQGAFSNVERGAFDLPNESEIKSVISAGNWSQTEMWNSGCSDLGITGVETPATRFQTFGVARFSPNFNESSDSNNNSLFGGAGNDTLQGALGNDTLDGGTGADSLVGGAGDDLYVIDNAADTLTENANEGTDTVRSSVSRTLAVNFENLELLGAAAINGTGNASANILTGNAAANQLNGGAGADSMSGGAGNDTYSVDNAGDVIIEAANAGTDVVQSTGSYVLGTNVENLILTGASAINGTGNALANAITGNAAANRISAGKGNDSILAGAGNDTLNAGVGLDTVKGEAGSDLLQIDWTSLVGATITRTVRKDGAGATASFSGSYTAKNSAGAVLSSVTFDTIENLTLNGQAVDLNFAVAAPGVTIKRTSTATATTEQGGTVQYSVVLDKAPMENVAIAFSSTDLTEGKVNTPSLTFTPQNWSTPQTLTIQGVDDYLNDGNVAYNITGRITTDDLNYNRIVIKPIALLNNDDGRDIDQTIYGTDDTDYLEGKDGNDRIYGKGGQDQLKGGIGNDRVYGQEDDDRLFGEAGNDQLYGGYDDDKLDGGIGNDFLFGEQGLDTLLGGDGNDYLDGGIENDSMVGGAGNDTYLVDSAGDKINDLGATTDIDTVQVIQTINYTLPTNIENAAINATGNANLTGNGLNNGLTGNSDKNILDGGVGNDSLSGGLGADSLLGGVGNDALNGGAGNDTFQGGDGVDLADFAAAGVDMSIDLTTGRATGDGTDLLFNMENILAGEGDDKLNGNTGANDLDGGLGADSLNGGAGNDTLSGCFYGSYGGRGEIDTIAGGAGNDIFQLGWASGRFYDDGNTANAGRTDYVVISDFTIGQDKLQLDGAASGYYLAASGVSGVTGTGLWAEQGTTDELIAIIRSANSTALNAANTVNTALFV